MQAGEPGSPGNECAQTSATPVTAHYSLCRYGKPTASPKATGLRGATAKGVRLRRLSRRRLEQDGSVHTPDSRDHPTGRLCGGGGACPLSGWKSGCTRDARLPPDNHVCTHTRARSRTCTHVQIHTHARTLTCICTHAHSCTVTCERSHACALGPVPSRTCAHTRTGTRARGEGPAGASRAGCPPWQETSGLGQAPGNPGRRSLRPPSTHWVGFALGAPETSTAP